MFATLEQTDVAELHQFRDPATGLRALIALHSTRLGPALGGCRCLPYPDEHTALNDVCRLARGMSYKAALAGLPLGGRAPAEIALSIIAEVVQAKYGR